MQKILALIQNLVAGDQPVLVAVIVQAAVSLIAGLGLNVSGSAVATISALVAADLGYFVHQNFKAKLTIAANNK